jgi:Ca-activated chloride channel family protein
MLLVVLALAQPRWPDLQTRIPAESVALQLVLDVSGSMSERDFAIDGQQVTRLEAAKNALCLLLIGEDEKQDGLSSELAGLLTFAARTEQVCPPTLSHSAVLRTLDRAQPVGTPPDSATNIGDAMAMGIDLLSRARPRQKVMVVLSDGEHNVPPDIVPDALKPRQAARLAQGLGIRVYTISVGSKADEAAQHAESAMEDVARMTGGSSFCASDTEGLLAICREIGQLEKTRVQSFQYLRWHEAYPWLGAAAASLLSSLLWLEYTRWRRLP